MHTILIAGLWSRRVGIGAILALLESELVKKLRLRPQHKSGSDKNAPTRASNLKRHLQRYHPKILEFVNEKDTRTNKNLTTALKSAKNKSPVGHTSRTRFITADKVTVTMTSEMFKKHLIELAKWRNG